jgi:hypothetical protein
MYEYVYIFVTQFLNSDLKFCVLVCDILLEIAHCKYLKIKYV